MLDPMSGLLGVGISWLVSGLKRIPLVNKYPKITSAILSTAIPAGISIYGQVKGVDVGSVQDLVSQAATAFTTSIATHEVVTHTINKVIDTQP